MIQHYLKRVPYAIILLILLVFSCMAGENEQDFGGTWISEEWGTMTLKQKGDQVTGSYTYTTLSGQQYGQIKGSVEEQTLVCQWWQSTTPGTSYQAAEQRGEAHLTLTKDGDHIQGKWRAEGATAWAGAWNMRRKQKPDGR